MDEDGRIESFLREKTGFRLFEFGGNRTLDGFEIIALLLNSFSARIEQSVFSL